MSDKKKELYVGTTFEIILFTSSDIITTSGGESGPSSSDTDWEGGIDW